MVDLPHGAELRVGATLQPAFDLDVRDGVVQVVPRLRRARLSVAMRFSKRVSAQFTIRGDNNQIALHEAFGEVEPVDGLRIRAGRMRLPGGLERETSSRRIPFMDRSALADLTLGRSQGVRVDWERGPALLSLAVAAAPDGDVTEGNAVDLALAGRLAGERWRVGARGSVRPRPNGAPGALGAGTTGRPLLDPVPYVGTALSAGVDAVGLAGPVRVTGEGLLLREGRNDLGQHLAHLGGYLFVGVAPGAPERESVDAGAAPRSGVEWVTRVDAMRSFTQEDGVGATTVGGVTGVAWAPWKFLRLQLEGLAAAEIDDGGAPDWRGGANLWMRIGP